MQATRAWNHGADADGMLIILLQQRHPRAAVFWNGVAAALGVLPVVTGRPIGQRATRRKG